MRQAGQRDCCWWLVAGSIHATVEHAWSPRKITKSCHRYEDYARQLSSGAPTSLNCANVSVIVMKITIIMVANSMRRLLY